MEMGDADTQTHGHINTGVQIPIQDKRTITDTNTHADIDTDKDTQADTQTEAERAREMKHNAPNNGVAVDKGFITVLGSSAVIVELDQPVGVLRQEIVG